MAAQFTPMKGLSRLGLASWMALARTSLPVPVLPLMKMVMSVSATSLA